MEKAWLVLADGRIFQGLSFGFDGETSGEVVFNTSITGYQEVLTDPSYYGQIVVMTYPHIGNCGINPDDNESDGPKVAGFIVREYSRRFSNWRGTEDIDSYLKRNKIVGGTEFDTRAIVRHIREKGAMPALLLSGDNLPSDAVERAGALPSMAGQDLVRFVTCCNPPSPPFSKGGSNPPIPPLLKGGRGGLRVILYDFGVKHSIIRMLIERGCEVTVVPAQTKAEDVLELRPDGVVLSNGPGDPAAVTYAVENIKRLLGRVPIFGICLGHQLLALALGGRTYKLKFGHRGSNQPVLNLETGRVEITSQNHGFAVDPSDLGTHALRHLRTSVDITHINLNDQTVEGLSAPGLRAFSVQYHPEASPGPHDSRYLFDEFMSILEAGNMRQEA